MLGSVCNSRSNQGFFASMDGVRRAQRQDIRTRYAAKLKCETRLSRAGSSSEDRWRLEIGPPGNQTRLLVARSASLNTAGIVPNSLASVGLLFQSNEEVIAGRDVLKPSLALSIWRCLFEFRRQAICNWRYTHNAGADGECLTRGGLRLVKALLPMKATEVPRRQQSTRNAPLSCGSGAFMIPGTRGKFLSF